MTAHWASDVPVSMPEPLEKADEFEPRIPMSGFVFTINGLFHDIDPAMHDELSLPTFQPQPVTEVIFDDELTDGVEYN